MTSSTMSAHENTGKGYGHFYLVFYSILSPRDASQLLSVHSAALLVVAQQEKNNTPLFEEIQNRKTSDAFQ